MVGGKNKVNIFKELQEWIAKRVTRWKEKYISKEGREILFKIVAQEIPTYSMGLFKLPKGLCDNINSILAKYWWGQSKNEKKIHWIRWIKLCEPKTKGGVGFMDIMALNLAILAKQAWLLIHHQHSLMYRVYKAWYFPTCSFLKATLGSNPSYVWRSLLQAGEVIVGGSVWKVGDGTTVEIENHRWLPREPCFRREGTWPRYVRELVDEDTTMGQR